MYIILSSGLKQFTVGQHERHFQLSRFNNSETVEWNNPQFIGSVSGNLVQFSFNIEADV